MDAADGPTELTRAVYAGDLPAVQALIIAGVDVNAIAEARFSPPLHDAIEHGRAEIARCLIAAGADVNHDVGGGQNPLFHAVDIESDTASQRGIPTDEASTELTEMLLAAGTVVTARAYELARAYNNYKALTLLEQARGGNRD